MSGGHHIILFTNLPPVVAQLRSVSATQVPRPGRGGGGGGWAIVYHFNREGFILFSVSSMLVCLVSVDDFYCIFRLISLLFLISISSYFFINIFYLDFIVGFNYCFIYFIYIPYCPVY